MKYHESSCKVKKIVEQINENKDSKLKLTNDKVEYIPLLCRFFDAVDVSHISEERQLQIMMLSSYEKIFTEILKNERNMNFYISLDLADMMIYKNEIKDIKKISLDEGYLQICMNIHRYLENTIEVIKSNSDYNIEILKIIERQIAKMNKIYRFDKECKDRFMKFLQDFCKEKKSMIFTRFTQNFMKNKEEMTK